MKRGLFVIFIVLRVAILQAQNVRFSWAKQWNESVSEAVNSSIATDASGNVYSARYFSLTTATAEIFVSKLNAAGDLIWVKQINGGPGSSTQNGNGVSIAVDLAGNVYISGYFTGTYDFDPGPNTFNLSSTGSIFIWKLDAAGNFVWVKQLVTIVAGLTDRMIAADASGNVYVTGSFQGNIDFDPGAGVYNLISGGNGLAREIFVLKLNTAGGLTWAKQLGGKNGTDGGNGYSVALDPVGNVCITGGFHGTVDFDPNAGVSNLQATSGSGQIFVSKFDAQGNFIWAKQMDGTENSFGQSISTDGAGNVYTLGSFRGTVDFDPGPGVFNQTGNNNNGVFISKLDAAGNFVWANQFSGTDNISGWGLVADASGNSFVTGSFYGTINFDADVCAFDLSSSGFDDIFIARLEANGQFGWVKKIGGTGSDEGVSMALDAAGNVYTSGAFQRTVDFDPGLGVSDLSEVDGYNIFLLKMSPCTSSTSSSMNVSACGSYTLNCKTYTTSGVYTQLLTNAAGCDSNLTLNLAISNNIPSSTSISMVACGGYFWNGRTISTSGLYSDTLVAANGCDSFIHLQLTVLEKFLSEDSATICPGQSYAGYNKTGTYTDTLTAVNGCDSIRTLTLFVQEKPVPDLGSVKSVCPGDTLDLSPGEFSAYLWQDGSTSSHFTVDRPGNYAVTVSNQCGSGKAGVLITEKICNILFPSAFSPNKDGKNETFRILNVPVLSNFDLSVFNRWGQKVFETRDYTKGWDGDMSGRHAETGVYVWFCRFKKSGAATNTEMKGTVLLIR
jgi:gliding motility-associated-like protein